MRATDTRHRPAFCPAPGLAGLVVPSCPRKRVRNDRAFHRARGARTVLDAGIPCALAHGQLVQPIAGLNRASDADRRLRSARGWTLRLAPCPRGVACADACPFVRTVARTCTWTVRPCCRRLPPSALTVFSDLRRPGRGIVAATRIPLHISKTLATPPSPEL